MYFQLDNTPENIRKKKKVTEMPVEADPPRLELAPFTSHPTITFENVAVNSINVKNLQVYNPTSQDKQIAVVKLPPNDLFIELSWIDQLVPAKSEIILEIKWSPKGPGAQRFTLQFADKNEKKRKFDVVVVCKTAVDPKLNKTKAKKKNSILSKSTSSKISPKMKIRKSPKTKFYIPCGDKYKNILEITNSLTEEVSKKYHRSPIKHDFINVCPQLPNQTSTSDFRRETYLVNDPEYDKENDYSFQMRTTSNNLQSEFKSFSPNNILSAIDNLEFTPVKVNQKSKRNGGILSENKDDNFHNILSENSPRLGKTKNKSSNIEILTSSEFGAHIDNIHNMINPFNDLTAYIQEYDNVKSRTNNIMIENNCNRTYDNPDNGTFLVSKNIPETNGYAANLTHSIIDLCDVSAPFDEALLVRDVFTKPTIVVEDYKQEYCLENVVTNEVSSFTPNGKNNLSDISFNLDVFNPKRCSTERKDCEHKNCKNTSLNEKVSRELLLSYSPADVLNSTYGRLSSGTYTKGDSPIIPLKPSNQSSPYSTCGSPLAEVKELPIISTVSLPRKLPFTEESKNFIERNDLKNAIRERNTATSIKDIIEANLWQRTPPRPISPSVLATIPEESTLFEMSTQDPIKKCDTFVINKTFEVPKPVSKPQVSEHCRRPWSKSVPRKDCVKTTVVHKSYTAVEKFDEDIERDCQYSYTNVKSVSTTMDPFLASTCLYDERAYDELQTEFKKWLNYLLTPPADLDTNLDDSKIDFGKAWIESRNKTVPVAPTKEQVSAKYHTSHRLESLRKTAKAFSEKPYIGEVFIKVANQVEKGILEIRADKNIHVNVGLQKMILTLLLCYNPLWLRIGLETLYDRKLDLTSNNDIMGLSAFISEHMFKDPYINAKHSTNMYSKQYVDTIKKFTLKKFLFLVYFLDQAKLNKIIPHDPCLFCRTAIHKNSKEILIQFTKEVIAGVGDITKHLKPTGYVVSHTQTYLHEFKYAVHNLAVDLKDGIRLTKLMEIILMRSDLTCQLRTPAQTRLRMFHNVKVALTALQSAGFTIVGDITEKDIADGHREKTLSLLWQLINKFRAPLFCQSAIILQKWWRKKYFKISIEKRIEYKKNYKYHNAATIIQSWWKSIVCRREFKDQLEKQTKASVVVQKYWRMWKCKRQYLIYKRAAITIQTWVRNQVLIHRAKKQLISLRLNAAATLIQTWYRLRKQKQVLQSRNTERSQFIQMRNSAVVIQSAIRAYFAMKKERKVFITIRISTIKIQQYYRAVVVRRYMRKQYLELKTFTLLIQRRYRANVLKNECVREFHRKREAVLKIQQFYRSLNLTRQIKNNYSTTKSATVTIQKFYRGYCEMKRLRGQFIKQRRSAIVIQKYLRGYLLMKSDRRKYLEMKEAVELARRERAAVVIQEKYRAYMQMEMDRGKFLILKSSVVKIQNAFRNYLKTKRIRQEFLTLQSTTLFIQRRYRGKLSMLKCLKHYEHMRCSAIVIQRYYKSYMVMKRERVLYMSTKNAAVVLQSWYRGLVARRKYIKQKNAAIKIQSFYRMFTSRTQFISMKNSATTIQRYYRNLVVTRTIKKEYETTRLSVIKIQSALRMVIERRKYLKLKETVVLIQKLYRIKMEHRRQELLKLTLASIVIQSTWRQYVKYNEYAKLKTSVIICQRLWRSKLQMREQRETYQRLKMSTIKLQALMRGHLIRKSIQRKQNAAIKIQTIWRSYIIHKKYQSLKASCLVLQQKWRAVLLMRKCREEFTTIKSNITKIQAYLRGYLVRKDIRNKNMAAIKIQTTWRRYVECKRYKSVLISTIKIQQKWKSIIAMRSKRQKYIEMRSAAIKIQCAFRSYYRRKQMLAAIKIQNAWRTYYQCKNYKKLKANVILCQRQWKSILSMRRERNLYLKQIASVIKLQSVIRGFLLRKRMVVYKLSATRIQSAWRRFVILKRFTLLRQSVILCHQRRRALIEMRQQRIWYENMRCRTVKLQALVRGYLARKTFNNLKKDREIIRTEIKRNVAATTIQKHWRGYEVRKQQVEHSRVAKLRRRWQQGGLESTQLTLAERSQDAMDVLCHFRDVASVIRAFKTLDYVTKVYPMMYSSPETALPIVTRLVLYMGATNRSVSTLETLQLGCAILLNLTKYAPTAHYVYQEEHIEVILTLMLHWCDKDNLLSRLFCTLLWTFAKYEDIQKNLSDVLRSPKSYKILCKVRGGLIRRRRMESRKRNSIHVALPVTPCLSKSFNDSLRLNMTPVKSGKQPMQHLPSTEPDYGIERTDQPKIFMDEIQAIDSVFLKYNLPLNFVSEN